MEEDKNKLFLYPGHAGKKRKIPKVDRNDVKQHALKLFCFFEEKSSCALANHVSEYLSCFYRTLLSLYLL